jgi:hypothetical protein
MPMIPILLLAITLKKSIPTGKNEEDRIVLAGPNAIKMMRGTEVPLYSVEPGSLAYNSYDDFSNLVSFELMEFIFMR